MNEQVIQIGGKSYKEAQVIMLPTEKNNKIGSLVKCPNTGTLAIINILTYESTQPSENQHLYLISDDEIKEGDWYFITESISKCESKYEANDLTDICKKIIATTDESLSLCDNCKKPNKADVYTCNCEVNPIARPSDDFIRKFVEKQGKITEVLVEYEEILDDEGIVAIAFGNNDYKLKVSPDNTITIKPVQEKTSWSREEVVALIQKLEKDGADYFGQAFLKQWIEENL